MYKSFTIKNYRCFRDFTLTNLERVNLIAGKNNSGKTSFLEALFIHIGPNNPDLPLRVNRFRGIEFFELVPEDLWGPLFYNKELDKTIELSSINERDERDTLCLKLVEAEEAFITQRGTEASRTSEAEPGKTSLAGATELVLDYENGSGKKGTSRSFISVDGKIGLKLSNIKHKMRAIFLPARDRFLGVDSERYSKLDRLGKADQLVHTMKLLEPRLKRLSVLVTGGVPLINGDIGLKEQIPVPFMGEGVVRLLSILLAIYDAPDGIVLIDEIENGLHHEVMADVWKAIAIAARESDTQIYATTHSWECVVAAHQAFSESHTYDFLFHRFDMDDGEIKPVTYDKSKLDTAIVTGLEIR